MRYDFFFFLKTKSDHFFLKKNITYNSKFKQTNIYLKTNTTSLSFFFKNNHVLSWIFTVQGVFLRFLRTLLNTYSLFYFMLHTNFLNIKNLMISNYSLLNINLLSNWLFFFLSSNFGYRLITFATNLKKTKVQLYFYNNHKKTSEFKRLVHFFLKKSSFFFLSHKLFYLIFDVLVNKNKSEFYKFKQLTYKNFLNFFK